MRIVADQRFEPGEHRHPVRDQEVPGFIPLCSSDVHRPLPPHIGRNGSPIQARSITSLDHLVAEPGIISDPGIIFSQQEREHQMLSFSIGQITSEGDGQLAIPREIPCVPTDHFIRGLDFRDDFIHPASRPHHRQQANCLDRVALARGVGTDEERERRQRKRRVAIALEVSDVEAGNHRAGGTGRQGRAGARRFRCHRQLQTNRFPSPTASGRRRRPVVQHGAEGA